MSPLSAYRRLLSLAGGTYVAVAFLARLPLAMSHLGTLLLVSSTTGSYAAGGLATGGLAVGTAVGAPLAGMLSDRIGQRPVLTVQSWGASAALVGIVVLVTSGAPIPAVVTVAAAGGLMTPQIGPMARVRWAPLVGPRASGPAERGRLVGAAFSYESAADEASFVLGPALVGGLVAVASPAVAVLVAAGLLATFGTAFALHPTARRAHVHHSRRLPSGRLLSVDLAVLVLAMAAIGGVFGGTQTGTTVLATAEGRPGMAGLVYALLGVGSAVAGLATVWLPERWDNPRRLRLFAAAMLVLGAPLLTVDSLGALAAVVTLLGVAVAPYMISVFATTERVVPSHRAGTAMTLLASGLVVGYAVGSAVAGRLGDAVGHRGAFVVTVVAAGISVAVALFAGPRLRRAISGGPGQVVPQSRTASNA